MSTAVKNYANHHTNNHKCTLKEHLYLDDVPVGVTCYRSNYCIAFASCGFILKLALCDVTAARRQKSEVEVIDLALTAKLSNLIAAVCTQDHLITDIRIAGLFHAC